MIMKHHDKITNAVGLTKEQYIRLRGIMANGTQSRLASDDVLIKRGWLMVDPDNVNWVDVHGQTEASLPSSWIQRQL